MARTTTTKPQSWTAADEQYLRYNYAAQSLTELSEKLNRTTKAIRSKAKVLKLTRGTRWPWTADEDQYIREHYAATATDKIAKHLGRTIAMVYNAAFRLGVEKTDEYFKDPSNKCGFKKGSVLGKAFRFEKGHTPANKGVRNPGWAPGRMAETQFKKGILNGTAKQLLRPIGTILADNEGFLRIKVREHDDTTRGWHKDVWPLLHHKVWIENRGPILPGHVIIFKDKNRNNCDFENLDQISQADNMRRNSLWNSANMPREIAELVQLTGAIKRQLNKKENNQHA